MNVSYRSLFLFGFRGTGKTTIGKLVSADLNWKLVEADQLLIDRAGKSHDALTKGGTDWQEFRRLEQEIFTELLHEKDVVVSTGGGVCVSGIVNQATGVPFGQENTALLKHSHGILPVLLTAAMPVLLARIKQQEMEKPETKRPILDQEAAKKIQAELEPYKDDPAKQKEILVRYIVEDNRKMLEVRQPLYAALTDRVVDTGLLSPTEAAQTIINFLK